MEFTSIEDFIMQLEKELQVSDEVRIMDVMIKMICFQKKVENY